MKILLTHVLDVYISTKANLTLNYLNLTGNHSDRVKMISKIGCFVLIVISRNIASHTNYIIKHNNLYFELFV